MVAVVRGPDIVESLVLRRIVAAAKEPDLPVVHDDLMEGAWRPTGFRGDQRPFAAVLAAPDVVLQTPLVTEIIVLDTAEQTHPSAKLDYRGAEARGPGGLW